MNSWINTGRNTLDHLPGMDRAVRVTMEGDRVEAAKFQTRNLKGRTNGLTQGEVLAIREMHATGNYTLRQLADHFGKSTTAIYYCIKGETYRDI